MLSIAPTTLFRCQLELLRKRNDDLQELDRVVTLLQEGRQLPAKYRDHALTGERQGQRDCHIRPDWLLIYEIRGDSTCSVLKEENTAQIAAFLASDQGRPFVPVDIREVPGFDRLSATLRPLVTGSLNSWGAFSAVPSADRPMGTSLPSCGARATASDSGRPRLDEPVSAV